MALLTGKTAVVTGGGSGIGRGVARAFAREGADVVIADVREEPKEGGTPTHELIAEETESQATFVHCDVTKQSDIEAAMDAADEFGGVDVLVNNAGIWHAEDFLETTEESYGEMMDINLKGAFFGAQAAIKRMLDHGRGGSVINMSSIAGLFGNGNWPTYAASKGGVTMLTYSLAHKFGGDGIRVNAIHPGSVQTKIGPEDYEGDAAGAEQFLQMVPLDRHGQPEDIAGVALFLASDLSSYVTGESVVVDGGWTSWR